MTPLEFAERSLLGVLLQQPERIREMEAWLHPDDFKSPAHQVLYRTIGELVREAEADAQLETVPDPEVEDVFDSDPAAPRISGNEGAARGQPTEEERNAGSPDPDPAGQVSILDVHARLHDGTDPDVARSSTLSAPGLHSLLETAPPASSAQPATYGMLVLEASVRRQVEAAGMRVGQAAELGVTLDVVDQALADVADAQHRWSRGGDPGPVQPLASSELAAAIEADGAPSVAVSAEDIARGEWAVVEGVLADPASLTELDGRLHPEDFADDALGNAYRAAQDVHAERASGVRVDPVTVAWRQQANEPTHGPGLGIDQLATMPQTSLGAGHLEWATDVVLRGSITRLTSTAADTVRTAAQSPGLQPGDVLHTAHLALSGVRSTAERASTPAPAAALASAATAGARPGLAPVTSEPRPPGTQHHHAPQRRDLQR